MLSLRVSSHILDGEWKGGRGIGLRIFPLRSEGAFLRKWNWARRPPAFAIDSAHRKRNALSPSSSQWKWTTAFCSVCYLRLQNDSSVTSLKRPLVGGANDGIHKTRRYHGNGQQLENMIWHLNIRAGKWVAGNRVLDSRLKEMGLELNYHSLTCRACLSVQPAP